MAERFIQLPSGEFGHSTDLCGSSATCSSSDSIRSIAAASWCSQGDWRQLDCGAGWQEFLQPLRTIDWVVFSRGVWDRREEVGRKGEVARAVQYLAHYANRVAMSNGRLLAIEGDDVWFRYKDHRDGGAWKTHFAARRGVHRALSAGICSPRACGGSAALACGATRVRTEKLTLLRRLLGRRRPARASGRGAAAQREEEPEEPPDLELPAAGGRARHAPQVPRLRRKDGVDVPDAASHGGRVDADAAEYGDAGGEWPGAAVPAALRLFVTTRHVERKPTACRDGFFSGRVTSGATAALRTALTTAPE